MARAVLILGLIEEERRDAARKTAQLRRRIRDQAQALELSNNEFRAHYRLNKQQFLELCNELKPYMAPMLRRTKVSVENKVTFIV